MTMNTPQTEDLARGNHVVPTEWAQKLERERDEWYFKAHENFKFTLDARAERDEAREELNRYKRQWEESRSENVECAK